MESNEEKILQAFLNGKPQAKSIKFSLNLEDVIVDVSIKRTKRSEEKKCENCNKYGGKKK